MGRNIGNTIIGDRIKSGKIDENLRGWIYNKSKDVLKYNKKN